MPNLGTNEATTIVATILCRDAPEGHSRQGVCGRHQRQARTVVDALSAAVTNPDACAHVFPDRSRCTLDESTHLSVPGLADLHHFPTGQRQ